MTYRQHIQTMIEEIEKLYDKAGMLRDHCHLSEKDTWNQQRNFMREASSGLRFLDDTLEEGWAAQEI